VERYKRHFLDGMYELSSVHGDQTPREEP